MLSLSSHSFLTQHHVLLAPYPTGEPRRLRKTGVFVANATPFDYGLSNRFP
ncbi:hypothetical protein KBB12_01405 [Candidatus Woesebacteria bacterium]|nr:hypothetical protein [Candidatus Woesebacteria bacterium]